MRDKTFIYSKEKKQKGITLVELMIAMVIGLVLTAGILQLFVSNKQTYRITESMSRLQENGRFAMHFLTKDIRMADHWGCRSKNLPIKSNLDSDAYFDLPIDALAGTDGAAVTDPDSITVKGVISDGILLTAPMPTKSADLQVANNKLKQGDHLLISDCSDGDIFQKTNTSGTVIKHDIAGSAPGNLTKPFNSLYDTDAQVYKLNFVTYSIQPGTSGQNSLFRSINGAAAQELVEGIEDMQILYGEDTDADGAANYYKASGNVNMNNVVSVRISLIAVTLEDNIIKQANSYSIFGGTPINPTDNRIRRVFTSTTVIRNRLP